MSWRLITEDDILTRLSGVELDAYRNAVLDPAQPDPIADATDQVTSRVRGAVAVKYLLGDSGTIPESLLGPALDILIIDIMSRAGGMITDPDDMRRKKYDDALVLLKAIASGGYAVEDATGIGYQKPAGGASRPTKTTQRVNRTNLAGF